MHITTPDQIESVAWEGELVPPSITRTVRPAERPVATIGRPEIWPVAEALENEAGRKWSLPLGDACYWLVRPLPQLALLLVPVCSQAVFEGCN